MLLLQYSEWFTDVIALLLVILYHILMVNMHKIHPYQQLWCFQGCHLIFVLLNHKTHFLLSSKWKATLASSRWYIEYSSHCYIKYMCLRFIYFNYFHICIYTSVFYFSYLCIHEKCLYLKKTFKNIFIIVV